MYNATTAKEKEKGLGLMVQMIALVVSILLLHGLIGKMAGLRAVLTSKIHAGVLRQLTGIWDRAELVQKFGSHDEAFYFNASQGQVLKHRRPLRWIFGNLWIEVILVAALLYSAMGNTIISPPFTWALVGVGAVYFIISSILTVRHSLRAKSQFDEEVAYLQRKRIEKFDNNQKKQS